MSISNLEEILNKFRKRVVKEAKTSLTKQKKNATKETYNSIKSDSKVNKNSFELGFYMAEGGKFEDKGVTGKNDSSFKGRRKTINKSTAGYRFGSGNFKGRGEEWEKRIDKWMYARGIQGRDKKGKFIKRKTVNFLIRRSIFQHGTKASLFFTKPFESAYKDLLGEVSDAYALDMDKFFDDSLK